MSSLFESGSSREIYDHQDARRFNVSRRAIRCPLEATAADKFIIEVRASLLSSTPRKTR